MKYYVHHTEAGAYEIRLRSTGEVVAASYRLSASQVRELCNQMNELSNNEVTL